jgi:hypothetical protein
MALAGLTPSPPVPVANANPAHGATGATMSKDG